MPAVAKVDVSSSAVKIASVNDLRSVLIIQNVSSADLYYGGTNAVTTSTGIKLAAGASLREDRTTENSDYFYTGEYYAISGGSAEVRVWDMERTR